MNINILIACEESQAVCKSFRELGFNAYSCDLKECSGGHPEWHLQMDVFEAIKMQHWDLMIAHPPCTFLSISGNKQTMKEICKFINKVAPHYEAKVV